jgi:hypothetical protein
MAANEKVWSFLFLVEYNYLHVAINIKHIRSLLGRRLKFIEKIQNGRHVALHSLDNYVIILMVIYLRFVKKKIIIIPMGSRLVSKGLIGLQLDIFIQT